MAETTTSVGGRPKVLKRYRLKQDAGPHYVGKRRFTAGQICETEHDLTKLFKNKFVRVSKDEPEEIDEDLEDELNELEGVESEPEVAKKVARSARIEGQEEPKSVAKDVTEDFPTAKKGHLKVFHDKRRGYFVTDEDDIHTVLSKDFLKTPAAVKSYIKGL